MKKLFNVLLVLIFVSILFVTGCEEKKDDNTVKISYAYGKATYSVSVPKDKDGNPKYEFTTEKPKGISVAKSFYLVTDKSMIGIATTGMSYNTSAKYKEKYGDKKATFDGYLEFIEDKDLFNKSYLPGLEQFEINGRKALRYYNRVGGSGSYKYYGYFYFVAVDDIYNGSKVDIVVNHKDIENLPTEPTEIDEETLNIINSLEIQEIK